MARESMGDIKHITKYERQGKVWGILNTSQNSHDDAKLWENY